MLVANKSFLLINVRDIAAHSGALDRIRFRRCSQTGLAWLDAPTEQARRGEFSMIRRSSNRSVTTLVLCRLPLLAWQRAQRSRHLLPLPARSPLPGA